MEKIPNRKRKECLSIIKSEISSLISGLNVTFYIYENESDDLVVLDLVGEDVSLFSRVLAKRFGIAPMKFCKIEKNHIYKGIITDSGKVGFGLYVDIGLRSPKRIDALLTLNTLRAQLADGEKKSLREIIRDFCLKDFVPLQVRITKIDHEEKKIWGELSDRQVECIKESFYDPLRKIIFTELSNKDLKRMLDETRIKDDVASISPLSLFSYKVELKIGVTRFNIISRLDAYCKRFQIGICSP
ncbi:MAG: DUF2110 family protein [Candidatus Bathyarchaeia archaeon]